MDSTARSPIRGIRIATARVGRCVFTTLLVVATFAVFAAPLPAAPRYKPVVHSASKKRTSQPAQPLAKLSAQPADPGAPAETEATIEEVEEVEAVPEDEFIGQDVPLSDVIIKVAPSEGELPVNFAAKRMGQDLILDNTGCSRQWAATAFAWEASAYCHRPLYFEEINLERHGHMIGFRRDHGNLIQPIVSGAHFFATIPILPYKMSVDPANECIYTLGHYRPGTYVQPHLNLIPLRVDAAAVQAGVIIGLIYLIP